MIINDLQYIETATETEVQGAGNYYHNYYYPPQQVLTVLVALVRMVIKLVRLLTVTPLLILDLATALLAEAKVLTLKANRNTK